MRIIDELQEWDRESNSYIRDVNIENDVTCILKMRFVMKDKSPTDLCSPELFLPDKINGLIPAVEVGEKLNIEIEFPRDIIKNKLLDSLNNMKLFLRKKGIELNYSLKGKRVGSLVQLKFNNKSAIIEIV
jgi:hypothetical protein